MLVCHWLGARSGFFLLFYFVSSSTSFCLLIHLNAECEFLVGNRPDAMKLFEGLLAKAESVGDRAKCYSNLVKALVSCGDCILEYFILLLFAITKHLTIIHIRRLSGLHVNAVDTWDGT